VLDLGRSHASSAAQRRRTPQVASCRAAQAQGVSTVATRRWTTHARQRVCRSPGWLNGIAQPLRRSQAAGQPSGPTPSGATPVADRRVGTAFSETVYSLPIPRSFSSSALARIARSIVIRSLGSPVPEMRNHARWPRACSDELASSASWSSAKRSWLTWSKLLRLGGDPASLQVDQEAPTERPPNACGLPLELDQGDITERPSRSPGAQRT
jgi:hypothetical protein